MVHHCCIELCPLTPVVLLLRKAGGHHHIKVLWILSQMGLTPSEEVHASYQMSSSLPTGHRPIKLPISESELLVFYRLI